MFYEKATPQSINIINLCKFMHNFLEFMHILFRTQILELIVCLFLHIRFMVILIFSAYFFL